MIGVAPYTYSYTYAYTASTGKSCTCTSTAALCTCTAQVSGQCLVAVGRSVSKGRRRRLPPQLKT